jgi:hypothetical protein
MAFYLFFILSFQVRGVFLEEQNVEIFYLDVIWFLAKNSGNIPFNNYHLFNGDSNRNIYLSSKEFLITLLNIIFVF